MVIKRQLSLDYATVLHLRSFAVYFRTCVSSSGSILPARTTDNNVNVVAVEATKGAHYRNQRDCRASAAHGKCDKTHGKGFAVRFSRKRTAKSARQKIAR
jgi:hypothetical protein